MSHMGKMTKFSTVASKIENYFRNLKNKNRLQNAQQHFLSKPVTRNLKMYLCQGYLATACLHGCRYLYYTVISVVTGS